MGSRFEQEPVAVPRSRPRLFAVDAASEAAVELQAELSDRLEAERFYKPEKRPFWPHVTVARVKPSKRSASDRRGHRRGRPMRVETPPGPLPAELCEPFGAVRVTLYRSSCGRRAPSTCRWPHSTCRPTGTVDYGVRRRGEER